MLTVAIALILPQTVRLSAGPIALTAGDRHVELIAEATYEKQSPVRPETVVFVVRATRLTAPSKSLVPSQCLELRYPNRKPQALWGRFEGRSSRFGIEEDIRLDLATSTFLELFRTQPTSIAVGKQAYALVKEDRAKLAAFVKSVARLKPNR